MKTTVTAAVETVTPEQARKWLARMTGNRLPMASHVEFLAGQITAGKWGINGQGLILTHDEILLDGQNRCLAVLKAGKSIEVLVVRGVDREQFATIDTGVPRNAAHVLQCRGRTDCINLSAALRMLANYRDGQWSGARARVTNARILDLDLAESDMTDSVRWAHNVYMGVRDEMVWRVCVSAFARHYMRALDEKHGDRFCNVLVTPTGPVAGWPGTAAQALRERLEHARKNMDRLTAQEVLASFILAWNSRGKAIAWQDLVWRRPKPNAKDAAPMPRFVTKGRAAEDAA